MRIAILHSNSYNFSEGYCQQADHWWWTKFKCGCNPHFLGCVSDVSYSTPQRISKKFLSTSPQCSSRYFQIHSFPSEPVDQSAVCTNYLSSSLELSSACFMMEIQPPCQDLDHSNRPFTEKLNLIRETMVFGSIICGNLSKDSKHLTKKIETNEKTFVLPSLSHTAHKSGELVTMSRFFSKKYTARGFSALSYVNHLSHCMHIHR